MIKSFRHKGIEEFFLTGSRRGINPSHEIKLRQQLLLLDAIPDPIFMKVPGWTFHALQGKLPGHWAMSVNGNWRLTFAFEDKDAILVDYQDYHQEQG